MGCWAGESEAGAGGVLGWRVAAGCRGCWTVNRGRVALDFVLVIAATGLGPEYP